jgi:hypothetical protein
MKLTKKVHGKKRRRRVDRKIFAISAVLLLAALFSIGYLLYSQNNETSGFHDFEAHYLAIMKTLNSSQCKLHMLSELGGKYNFTELFSWEHSRLTFESDPAGWFEDPFEILSSGKGICAQFSIVYVSACLALGIQSRLVVATNTTAWNFIHVWSEVYFNGSWAHVDPSDQVWNQPLRYQNWDWGKYIGQDVRMYAFDDGKSEDVTSTYD